VLWRCFRMAAVFLLWQFLKVNSSPEPKVVIVIAGFIAVSSRRRVGPIDSGGAKREQKSCPYFHYSCGSCNVFYFFSPQSTCCKDDYLTCWSLCLTFCFVNVDGWYWLWNSLITVLLYVILIPHLCCFLLCCYSTWWIYVLSLMIYLFSSFITASS